MMAEPTIIDWVIAAHEHSQQTINFAENMFQDLHNIMKSDFSDLWCEELKTICAVICYWMASSITEKNKLTYKIINQVLGVDYDEEDLVNLKLFIAKKLSYDILIYL